MWLAREPGYRKQISYSDADYFNLPDKDIAVARARRERKAPTLDQVRQVLETMPDRTPIERRNRALFAFTVVTTARVSALASFRLGHVNLAGGYVDQDARFVRTKRSKTFRTYFMPFDKTAMAIVKDWVTELKEHLLWGPDDPLFAATETGLNDRGEFAPIGLARRGWSSTGPVRKIFEQAFAMASLPYYHPYSFRSMITQHAMKLDLTPEEMKALSQNLGHSGVLTTFTSYGTVPDHRQGELIKLIGNAPGVGEVRAGHVAELEAVLAKIKAART